MVGLCPDDVRGTVFWLGSYLESEHDLSEIRAFSENWSIFVRKSCCLIHPQVKGAQLIIITPWRRRSDRRKCLFGTRVIVCVKRGGENLKHTGEVIRTQNRNWPQAMAADRSCYVVDKGNRIETGSLCANGQRHVSFVISWYMKTAF